MGEQEISTLSQLMLSSVIDAAVKVASVGPRQAAIREDGKLSLIKFWDGASEKLCEQRIVGPFHVRRKIGSRWYNRCSPNTKGRKFGHLGEHRRETVASRKRNKLVDVDEEHPVVLLREGLQTGVKCSRLGVETDARTLLAEDLD